MTVMRTSRRHADQRRRHQRPVRRGRARQRAPGCTGVTVASTDDNVNGRTASTTTVTSNSVEDISGPCDEAEHANDPRCTGAAAGSGTDDSGHHSGNDDSGHHGGGDDSGRHGGDDD